MSPIQAADPSHSPTNAKSAKPGCISRRLGHSPAQVTYRSCGIRDAKEFVNIADRLSLAEFQILVRLSESITRA